MAEQGFQTESLGSALQQLFDNGFFRPLARPSAAVYVDCAERITQAADEGGQLQFDDARQLVRDTLSAHPEVHLEEDEGGKFTDLNLRASHFFNRLLDVRWIESRRVSLDEHWILVSPRLRMLLSMLRDLAENRLAELKDFAATIRSICSQLPDATVFDPKSQSGEELRLLVKGLLDQSRRADNQMHAVETLVLQHETAQRTSQSAAETLERFLVGFHAGEHMVCYDALQGSGLLGKVNQAQAVAFDAGNDPFVKQRLAEGLSKHLRCSDSDAYVEAERMLGRLSRHLQAIPVKRRLIDGRIADFSRLSSARYRYQMEIRGRRPERVKSYVMAAAAEHADSSFSALGALPGMALLCPDVAVYFGMDSLSRPRRLRPPTDLSIEDILAEPDADAATDEIRRHNLDVLTPQRAVRMIEQILPEKGNAVSTEDLELVVEDDVLDLLAVLSFDRGPATGSHRQIRWRVTPTRGVFCVDPEAVPKDPIGELNIDRLTIERLS